MADASYPLALQKGSILAGQYIIEEVLGQDGFGITYRATDYKNSQQVAIREFFPDTLATRIQTTVTVFPGERGESFAHGKTCFLQEAETLAEFIGNENTVRVHSCFEENQTAYYVMNFVEGASLDAYIKEQGGRIGYEEAEKLQAFRQALLGEGAPVSWDDREAMLGPVPQRISAASPEQAAGLQERPGRSRPERKGKLLWAGIGSGVAACVALAAIIMVSVGQGNGGEDADSRQEARYDKTDDAALYSTTEPQPESEDEPEPTAEPEATEEPEAKPAMQISRRDLDAGIVGNTPNNIAQNGEYLWGDSHLFMTWPGMGGFFGFDVSSGDSYAVEEEGNISCISNVGGQVYYLKDKKAYCAGVDGTGKAEIPELKEFAPISHLYLSQDFYYVHHQEGLQCVERNTGKTRGTVSLTEPQYFTFVGGYLYYITYAADGSYVWRLPADDFEAEAEEVLGPEDNIYECYEIVSDGDYLYALCDVLGTQMVHVIQYDTKKAGIVSRYGIGREEGMSVFGINVSNQYIYFVYHDFEHNGERAVYRFKAEEGATSTELQLVYEGAENQELHKVIASEKSQSLAIYGYTDGLNEMMVLTKMDGSGEPDILDKSMFSWDASRDER